MLPGLIDGHCHLLDFVGELYFHLGITTCPDITQNDDEWTLRTRDGTNPAKSAARVYGPPAGVWSGRRRPGRCAASAAICKNPRGWPPSCAKKAAGIEIIKFNEYVAPEVIKAGAEEAQPAWSARSPVIAWTCFSPRKTDFAGVEHHWGMGMTTIGDVKKRWEVHQQRMTRKINTADLAYYYEPENFDKVVKATVEKNVSWSPTIATWYRPLHPASARFKERELSILDKKECPLLAAGPA